MSIPFAAGGGGAESRWIRIEQRERDDDEGVTLAEAAAIIDSLFQIDPCEQGMGGGGEPANEENEPAEEEVAAETAAMLERAGLCVEAEYWDAVVHVYRSHQSPSYVLRSETAEVIGAGQVRGSRRESVEIDGRVIHLTWPYAGNLQGLPVGMTFEARGSSIILSRPLRGELTLRYDTLYDRVTLRIPTDSGGAHYDPVIRAAMEYAPGDPFAVAGRRTASSRGHTNRRELPSASVVAFWGDLAASCELEPPEQDDSAGADEIAEICGEGGHSGGGGGGDDEPNDCWRTVYHYDRCNCSRKIVNERETMEPAPCDGADSGSDVGMAERFGKYVRCEGEEDDVHDPEFYKEKCCGSVPQYLLPRCREFYDVYRGGAEIEHGPEHWKNVYGENVTMVAVMPKEGICGDEVTEWQVKSKNCCDEVAPIVPREEPPNPTTIATPGAVTLCIEGGRAPYTWRTGGGYVFFDQTGEVGPVIETQGTCASVSADSDVCDNTTVEVTDGCSTARMPLSREEPRAPMRLEPDELTASPNSTIIILARDGQGEIYWDGGGLEMLLPQGGHSMSFKVPENFCGQTLVTATDACTRMAQAIVLSTRGRWVEQTDFDPCTPPWGGIPCVYGNIGYGNSYGVLLASWQGYRAYLGQAAGYVINRGLGPYAEHCREFEGDCDDAVAASSIDSPCGYTGTEIGYTINCTSVPVQPTTGLYEIISPLCHRERRCTNQGGGNYAYNKRVYAASQFIMRLWRWECE